MARLEEQLENEKRREKEQGGEIKPPPKDTPLSPQEEIAKTESIIKAFKLKQELQSIELGYESFKLRESSLAGKENELADKETELQTKIGKFELEQKDRMEKLKINVDDYNKAYALLKTSQGEVNKLMSDALKQKSEAESIIKSQTLSEQTTQEKQEAYDENMDSAISLLAEIVKVLRRQEDGKVLSLAVALSKDLTLIQWLQYKKSGLQTLADIIAVDCDRIVDVCEGLQNSKTDYSKLLKYLLDSTEWLQNALKIEFKPND
jgi:chromosome segregation ATPase